MNTQTMKLLGCIGEISDEFLDEAEAFAVDPIAQTRKRLVRYSALATVASVGVAVTYWWLRSKSSSSMISVAAKSA